MCVYVCGGGEREGTTNVKDLSDLQLKSTY